MMHTKKLVVLGSILGIAIVALIIIHSVTATKKTSPESLLFYPGFSGDASTKMLIANGADTAVLIKKNNIWYIVLQNSSQAIQNGNEYPADSNFIAIAFEKLAMLSREHLIAQNPAKHAELEVTDSSGTYVEVWDAAGKSTGGLYVGKGTAQFDTYFVRAKNSNDVYTAGQGFRYPFFTNKAQWKSKTITQFDRNKVQSLSITFRNNPAIEMVRTPPNPKDSASHAVWTIIKPVHAMAYYTAIENMINSLSFFKGMDIETDTTLTQEAMGLANPAIRIGVTLNNGTSMAVIIGTEKIGSGAYWVKREGNNSVVFLINTHPIDNDFGLSLGQIIDKSAQVQK
jgi:hypothetical protein